jgi:hypothetical protein
MCGAASVGKNVHRIIYRQMDVLTGWVKMIFNVSLQGIKLVTLWKKGAHLHCTSEDYMLYFRYIF